MRSEQPHEYLHFARASRPLQRRQRRELMGRRLMRNKAEPFKSWNFQWIAIPESIMIRSLPALLVDSSMDIEVN
jgi:hypothetical protein